MRNPLSAFNRTHFEHAAIAVVMQLLLIGLFALFGQTGFFAVLAASLPGPCVFFAREHTQREALLLKSGLADWDAVLAAFRFWEWDTDSLLDFFSPLAAVVVVGLGMIVVW